MPISFQTVDKPQQNHYHRRVFTHAGRKLIPFPAPQCVVFYNGEEEIPDEQEDFQEGKARERDSCLELKVRVLNISHGHNAPQTKVCGLPGEYARFIAKIREFQDNGLSTDLPADSAIEYCIEHGILSDTLTTFWAEVKKTQAHYSAPTGKDIP